MWLQRTDNWRGDEMTNSILFVFLSFLLLNACAKPDKSILVKEGDDLLDCRALANEFEFAKNHGKSAELMPGDAIFIPSLWWHQVESFGPLNVLINYWWRNVPSYMGNPMDALMHSILSVRDLPQHQKDNWINMFKHYVFDYENKNFDHIPDDIHGAVGDIDDNLAKKIRALLLNNLNR